MEVMEVRETESGIEKLEIWQLGKEIDKQDSFFLKLGQEKPYPQEKKEEVTSLFPLQKGQMWDYGGKLDLAKGLSLEKRLELAENPETPVCILNSLSEDGDHEVREKVIRNPNSPPCLRYMEFLQKKERIGYHKVPTNLRWKKFFDEIRDKKSSD